MGMLFVARHAPSAIEEGTCVGRIDVPSRRDPGDVAEALLESWIGPPEVCRVWSSPLQRCLEVARVLAARWSVSLQIDTRLLEISYGHWEGRSWDEIERTDADLLQAWMRDWRQSGPPGGESAAMVEARVQSWWESLAPDHNEALIGHAGVIRALNVVTGASTWDEAMRAAVPHLKWIRVVKPTPVPAT
jgi:alpha-ribazole phosphatase